MPEQHAWRSETQDGTGNAAPPEMMSGRAMVLIAGIASTGVVGVLGLTLLMGGSKDSGATVTPDESVVIPANGAATAPVPSVVGLGSNTAIKRLAAQRIPLGAVIRVPSSQSAGLVVRSYPPGGSTVRAGAPVTLYVSAGQGGTVRSSFVAVPYFIGLTEQQARSTAAGLGFQVSVTGTGKTVAAQQPTPGTVQSRGTTLTFTLK